MADYNTAERREMAANGEALPDGSFPIKTVADLEDAIKTWGIAKNKAAAKTHIIKRARALRKTSLLPSDWISSHAEPATVTVSDVEIVRVGNWASQLSGRVPITAADIADIAAASADPEVDHAPVKIGHVDPRFDGEPAFGWLSNVRAVGDRVLADITDVPSQMAHLMHTAFKRRSAEIAWGVKTPSGRTYKAALAGLALLGVTPPAVKGLADVVARYSGPSNQADSYSTVTIVDGDDGELAELQASVLNAQGALDARRAFLAAHSGDLPPSTPDDMGNDPIRQGVNMTDDEVRAALGLPAEVPVTDQLRTIAAAPAAPAATDGSAPVGGPSPVPTPAVAAPPAAGVGLPPTTTVDSAALEALQAMAAEGAGAMRILKEQERERVLTAALSAGRIAPASVEAYRKLYDAEPVQTQTLLAGLPVVFSTVTNFSASAAGRDGKPVDEHGISEDAWNQFSQSLGLR